MKKVKLALCGTIFLTLLAGCKQEDTHSYNYLMQHPDALMREATRCQTEAQTDVDTCQVVQNAAMNFQAMINDDQQEPEKFGEKLLSIQMDLAQKRLDLIQAQHNLHKILDQGSASEITAAKQKVEEYKRDHADLLNEVRSMLAVVNVNISPE